MKPAQFTRFALGSAAALMLAACNVEEGSEDAGGVDLAALDLGGTAPTVIVLEGPDDIDVVQGDSFAVDVSGDADAVTEVRFVREGDTLTVYRPGRFVMDQGTARITVTLPALQSASITGSGDLSSEVLTGDVGIDIAGSGSLVAASVDTTALDIAIAGSGNVTIGGESETLRVGIAGSGDVDARRLTVATADVSIEGSGDVALRSDGTVRAAIAGSGDVRVTGSASCEGEVYGSGELLCEDVE